jgi:hypothetical protein
VVQLPVLQNPHHFDPTRWLDEAGIHAARKAGVDTQSPPQAAGLAPYARPSSGGKPAFHQLVFIGCARNLQAPAPSSGASQVAVDCLACTSFSCMDGVAVMPATHQQLGGRINNMNG